MRDALDKLALFIALTDMLGFPCEAEKHVAMCADSEYLGVISDLSGFADGELRMDISVDRRESLLELVSKHRFALSKGPASSIFGKARFMLTSAYGAVGRACLQPIKARQFSESPEITP